MKDRWGLICKECEKVVSGTTNNLVDKGWGWTVAELNNGCIVKSAVCPDCSEEGVKPVSSKKIVEEFNKDKDNGKVQKSIDEV